VGKGQQQLGRAIAIAPTRTRSTEEAFGFTTGAGALGSGPGDAPCAGKLSNRERHGSSVGVVQPWLLFSKGGVR
jgi:hypothetical protein